MEVRYTPDPESFRMMDTTEIRDHFLIDDLFAVGQVRLIYCDVDRAIAGSAVPKKETLTLSASDELRAEYFCERRELGILNIGQKGSVIVDNKTFDMDNLDCLYVGLGSKDISFSSADSSNPAKFYLLSYPAHKNFPTTFIKKNDAAPAELGDADNANKRTIFKYIHPEGIKSCQLVMGFTTLEKGSVWNTMPPHTHARRMEIYLYFNIADDHRVFHLMGEPSETRHMVMADGQAVISPSWSMHAGAGTATYTFCWGMGGENQAFDDMDFVPIEDLR